jgi:hypothetical protein
MIIKDVKSKIKILNNLLKDFQRLESTRKAIKQYHKMSYNMPYKVERDFDQDKRLILNIEKQMIRIEKEFDNLLK